MKSAKASPSICCGSTNNSSCKKEALKEFTVCFDHVTKEALWMMIGFLRAAPSGRLRQSTPDNDDYKVLSDGEWKGTRR